MRDPALIDSEQQDRWEQLSAILGFGEFGRARARLQRLRTTTDHDSHVKRVRELATRAVQPLTAVGTEPLETDPEELRRRSCGFLGLPADASWDEVHANARTQLEEFYSRDRRPAGLDRMLVDVADLRSSFLQLEEATAAVLAEVEQHRKWHAEHARSEFAAQGLALRESGRPDACPFCGEPTLTPERVAVLEGMAPDPATRPADSRGRIEAALRTLQVAGPTNADVVAAVLETLQECDERSELQAALEDQDRLAEARERLGGLAEGFLAATDRARQPGGDTASLESLADQLVRSAGEIADCSAALRARIESAKVSLTQRFTSLGEDDRTRVAALQKAQLLAENASAVRAAWRVRELQSGLADLIGELENTEKNRMATALGLLSDDIRAYYEELSPGHHIAITGVTVRDSKRRQASLEATSFGRSVNPVTMFSEAEGNCLGLSLYFSQRVDRNPGWRMILLDDPVQSMDAGHEQGLVNLLARVSRERQIVVMTHDRRFAEAVEAQFAAVPSFTRYNLYRTSEPEPRLELHTGRLAELLSYAERNARGDQALRESCAGAVRKGVERFARDLAAKNGSHLKKKMSIEEMVDRLHQEKLVDNIEVGTLHRLRRFGSRGAHDDASVNAAEPAIRASVQALRQLEATYFRPSQPQLRLVAGGDPGDAATS